ncbi:MAG: hypothetical protein ACO1SX_09020 [Actinomycetota bacterium]
MRALPGDPINWIAGAVIAGGVVWAGAMLLSPREAGPDVAGLQALADRLAQQQGPTLSDRTAGGRRAATNEAEMIAMPRIDYAALRRARRRLAASNNVTPEHAAASAVSTPSPAPPAPAPAVETDEADEDVLKDLALVGVTTANGKDSALLVHLESQERESVSVGGTILGFKVKAIQPEAVVLARGTEEHTLRLGDHAVTVASAGNDTEAGDDDENDASPFERRRDRGDDRDRSRFAGWFRGFGDRSLPAADFRSRGDDNDPRRLDNASDRANRTDRGDRTFGPSGFGAPIFGGGFAGFDGAGGFGSGNRQGSAATNTFASGTTRSTTNPQTARRRGSVASGDTASQPTPIANPQTQRRRGTTAQPAFGAEDNTVRQSGGTNARRSR